MNWKGLGAIITILGVGALIASRAEGSSTDRLRKEIRSHFEVGPDCQIVFRGTAMDAPAFWQRYDVYLSEMIRLASTLQITDARGVASYTMLNLFPECDQTKQLSGSFEIARNAAQFRISKLLEQGQ